MSLLKCRSSCCFFILFIFNTVWLLLELHPPLLSIQLQGPDRSRDGDSRTVKQLISGIICRHQHEAQEQVHWSTLFCYICHSNDSLIIDKTSATVYGLTVVSIRTAH